MKGWFTCNSVLIYKKLNLIQKKSSKEVSRFLLGIIISNAGVKRVGNTKEVLFEKCWNKVVRI